MMIEESLNALWMVLFGTAFGSIGIALMICLWVLSLVLTIFWYYSLFVCAAVLFCKFFPQHAWAPHLLELMPGFILRWFFKKHHDLQ